MRKNGTKVGDQPLSSSEGLIFRERRELNLAFVAGAPPGPTTCCESASTPAPGASAMAAGGAATTAQPGSAVPCLRRRNDKRQKG